MTCPKCAHKTRVINSRTSHDNTIRRRRACNQCGHRLTTYETPHAVEIPKDQLMRAVNHALLQLAEQGRIELNINA